MIEIWGSQSDVAAMWRCVLGWKAADVSKDIFTVIFKGKQSTKKYSDCCWRSLEISRNTNPTTQGHIPREIIHDKHSNHTNWSEALRQKNGKSNEKCVGRLEVDLVAPCKTVRSSYKPPNASLKKFIRTVNKPLSSLRAVKLHIPVNNKAYPLPYLLLPTWEIFKVKLNISPNNLYLYEQWRLFTIPWTRLVTESTISD
jgi:hypothetical protein